LGRLMLKGDNITLIQNVNPQAMSSTWMQWSIELRSSPLW
jgi:hypothetical protein